MKVLVTGATGLLGSHLLKELQQRHEQIRALGLPVENAEKLKAQRVEVVRGDITDASTLAPAVKDIEIIFHLAGMMVDLREGIRLAAEWLNAGGMEQPFTTQVSHYAPLAGARK